MQQIAIGFLLLSTILTIIAVVYYFRYGKCGKSVEGFVDDVEDDETPRSAKQRIQKANKNANNVLLNVIAVAKRASAHVTDPKIWSERLHMATMSPVDLARNYLKSQLPVQK